MTAVTTLLVMGAVGAVLCARRAVRHTTLRLARRWALIALTTVLAVWVLDVHAKALQPAWSGMAWYLVAVLLLCPPVAVLGARRPGVGVWNAFVLLPLLAVLGWPALAAILAGPVQGRFSLEAPPLIGFLVVLVMGYGNYIGTRFWLSALLAGGAALLFLVPLVSTSNGSVAPLVWRAAGIWCLSAAAISAALRGRMRHAETSPLDRTWLDFRDQFGIVWAQRVQERVNERAAHEGWPVRLERRGFGPLSGRPEPLDRPTAERIEHTLRWLLRRFVDEPWLDERLGGG